MKALTRMSFSYKSFLIKYSNSKILRIICCILLSWFFALCSQIIIPLPFNFVPISLQPLPLFLCALILGWPAVSAYFLCLFQTALGSPFFSGFEGGIVKLVGPTAGYIWGFAFSMIFLGMVKNYKNVSYVFNLAKLLGANLMLYFFGLSWLSFFIASEKILAVGLTPFIAGNLIKMLLCTILVVKYNSSKR